LNIGSKNYNKVDRKYRDKDQELRDKIGAFSALNINKINQYKKSIHDSTPLFSMVLSIFFSIFFSIFQLQ